MKDFADVFVALKPQWRVTSVHPAVIADLHYLPGNQMAPAGWKVNSLVSDDNHKESQSLRTGWHS